MTSMRHTYAIGLLVFLNLLVFGQTATFDFVGFDDPYYLINNPHFNGGLTLENIRWSFTTGYFVNWHPMTWLSYFLDNALYGMDARGYHVTNLILHTFASILLYLVLFRMTKKRAESLIVAVLFAIHPQHVQSVAWISERKDVLSAFFLGLTLLAYHRFTETRRIGWYLITALAFALGLMSKPMLVTLPCVLLLLDYWPLNRLADKSQVRRAILEKIPLIILAIASSVITFLIQNSEGVTSTVTFMGIGARIANASHAYGLYLFRTVWPFELTFFYPLVISKISYGWAAISAGVLVFITAIVLRARKEAPALLIGWLWYLGTLVPVIGLIQVGGQASADRYTYIPLIGIFIGIAFTVHPRLSQNPQRRRIALYLYPAVLALCVFTSMKETYFWKDTVTLASRGIQMREDNHLAYQMLGKYYLDERELELAAQFYTAYFDLNPNDADVQLRLASIFEALGEIRKSEQMLEFSIEMYPDNAIAYFHMGQLMERQNDLEKAAIWYGKSVSLKDPELEYFIRYGNILAQTDNLERSLEQYEVVLRTDPDHVEALHSKASSQYFHGKTEEALESVERCLEIDPDYEPSQRLLKAISDELATRK